MAMKKVFVLIVVASVCGAALRAQNKEDAFEAFKRQMNAQEEMFGEQRERDFEEFKARYYSAFEEFKKSYLRYLEDDVKVLDLMSSDDGLRIEPARLAPAPVAAADAAVWVLYLLLVLAGMTVGFDLKALGIVRELRGRILLIPLGVVAGTLCGSTLAWLILSGFSDLSLPESLAVGAGFGYYSLATVIITRLGDPALGSVALLSNMIHEALALLLPPLVVRLTGRLGPVLAGGAAAMDTCLPVVAQVSGERCAILAVFSGMCLTLLVPVIVPLLMALR